MSPGSLKTDFYTTLVSGVFFPLHELIKKHDTVAIRKEMEISQWWDEGRLEQLRLSRLRRLLASAEARVPYYRNLFADIGFKVEEVASLADLARLPLLDKSTIRANSDALKAENATGLARFNTGGSSGEPLVFYIGKERVSHDVAAKWRATRWWNVDIGDPEVVIWGSPIELGAQDGLRALRDRMLRTRLLPAFEMSEKKLDQFLDEISTVRPKMLFGYPSALSHIARHAEARGRRMDDLGIRVAFVTSERLYDEQRQQISKTFGCPVANGYGGRDAGFIAHECPQGRHAHYRRGYHRRDRRSAGRAVAAAARPAKSSLPIWPPQLSPSSATAPAISACWIANPAVAEEGSPCSRKSRAAAPISSLRRMAPSCTAWP